MKPSQDFSSRYKAAKEWRDNAEPFIRETLSFCCPGRENDFDKGPDDKSEQDTSVWTGLAEDLATDLAGDLVTYFTPAELKWAEYLVNIEVDEADAEAVMELVSKREDDLFDIVSSSNYNDIAPQWAFEAASHGTAALWVQQAHLQQPIHCEVVPPEQLLITRGHLGYLDRFRETHVLASSLPALFQGWDVDLKDEGLRQKINRPGALAKVCWGFWLDWADPAIPLWRCEITVDGKRITPETPLTLGPMAGSCPLLVGRFNPQINKPWGRGAGWRALPDLRVLNEVSEAVLSGLDQTLMNTIIYPDDGFLDLSEGLEAGRAYPAHRGFTREQIYDLSRNVNTDQGYFTEERFEEKIRRTFYQDGPRQRGETPPTAAQWLDERRRVQQRLGKPSAPLWTELLLPLVQRFEYLAVQTGKIPEAISHNGQTITVMPISPLQKAQNQDKVMVARSNIEMIVTMLGEGTPQFLDVPATLSNIVKTSGDDVTVILPAQKETNEPAPPAV